MFTNLTYSADHQTTSSYQQIGETIENCAIETERIIRRNEEGASPHQSQKSSDPTQNTQTPASRSIYVKGSTHPQAPNAPHFQNVHHTHHHENAEPVRALNRLAHQTQFSSEPYNHLIPTQGYSLKRYSSVSLSELEQRTRAPLQIVTAGRRDNIHPILTPRGPRPNKRIRNNWTDAENALFFDAIRKNANQDETTVLREIVTALHGSRNWVQCKGHFRNLLAVGKITQNRKGHQLWEVHEQTTLGSTKSKEAERIPAKALDSSKYGEPRATSVNANGAHLSTMAPSSSAHKKHNHLSSNTNLIVTKAVEHQDNIQNTPRNGTGDKTGRSASIDRLVHNISQERDNRNAQMHGRTNAIDLKQRQPEIAGRLGENPSRSKGAQIVAGTKGAPGEQGDVARDRETAIFMSKQAAAKEAYEQCNYAAHRESDISAT